MERRHVLLVHRANILALELLIVFRVHSQHHLLYKLALVAPLDGMPLLAPMFAVYVVQAIIRHPVSTNSSDIFKYSI